MLTKLTLKRFHDDITKNHANIIDFGFYKVKSELHNDPPKFSPTLLLSLIDGTRSGTITEFKSSYPVDNNDLCYMIRELSKIV